MFDRKLVVLTTQRVVGILGDGHWHRLREVVPAGKLGEHVLSLLVVEETIEVRGMGDRREYKLAGR
jgi:hypothetical protein